MTKINIKGIQVENMQNCSGVFWGNKNNHHNYRYSTLANEAFGKITGNMNVICNSKFMKNKNCEG